MEKQWFCLWCGKILQDNYSTEIKIEDFPVKMHKICNESKMSDWLWAVNDNERKKLEKGRLHQNLYR